MSAEPTRRTRVTRVATTSIPTRHGSFFAYGYRDEQTGNDHVVLTLGALDDPTAGPPLVRVHSECLTGDSLGSQRCDCRDQLDAAQAAIAAAGRGAVVYLRGHEGRGIGLSAKLRAYELQDDGLDTFDANLALGLPVDAREYGAAAAMLHDLGVTEVELLSGNPAKESSLQAHGIDVTRVSLHVQTRPTNSGYLSAKRERMGHEVTALTRGFDAQEREWRELLAGRVPTTGELADRYGPMVSAGQRHVIAQLGQSLDGFIAARTGDACFVTGEADRVHLHRVRALVDAVVVGVGTVVADDCRLTVRAATGHNPVRVVLDPSGRAPRTAHVFNVPESPTLWLVAEDLPRPQAPARHVEVIPLRRTGARGKDRFAPADVLALLEDRGLARVLVEGGGVTVSRVLTAGALDRLLVTTAALLVGDGVPGLRFDGEDLLKDALRAPTRRFVLGDDVCVELDLTAGRGESVAAAVSGAGSASSLESLPVRRG